MNQGQLLNDVASGATNIAGMVIIFISFCEKFVFICFRARLFDLCSVCSSCDTKTLPILLFSSRWARWARRAGATSPPFGAARAAGGSTTSSRRRARDWDISRRGEQCVWRDILAGLNSINSVQYVPYRTGLGILLGVHTLQTSDAERL